MSTALRMVAGVALASFAAASLGQQKVERVDFGKREYEANCASCHGASGKGNGPVAPFLTKSAPDLTQLTKKNGGVFPISRVYDVIDGEAVPAHGTRDMPVWGREYKVQAAEYYQEMPYNPEAYVRARILSLVEYLNRMQEK